MTASDELIDLARILADWIAAAPSYKIYLFGSRVRGDHRPTSDVDIVLPHQPYASDADISWLLSAHSECFASLKSVLPGPLQIVENDADLAATALSAKVVYQDRQVFCVWTAPKPIPP